MIIHSWLTKQHLSFHSYRLLGMTLIICIGLVFVIGCQNNAKPTTDLSTVPLSFENLCGLTSEQFAQMDEPQISKWLDGKYAPTPISRTEMQNMTMLNAGDKNRSTGLLIQNGRLSSIVQSTIKGLTLGKVIADLGTPETFSASDASFILNEGTIYYVVAIAYTKRGFSLMHEGNKSISEFDSDGRRTIQLQKEMVIDFVTCYSPESREQQQKPWPGFGAWVPLERFAK